VLSAALRSAGGIRRPPPEPEPVMEPELRPIHVPRFERPVVSIVIPMHSSGAIGERTLRQLVRVTTGVAYELVLVDDTADAATARVIGAVQNAQVVTNEQNTGFLRSNNRAAEVARGDYLVLLNDDTEVQPGWLEALVDCAGSDGSIAYVASKLVYPDGRLQEAGGIVWSDGTGWNYGRGDNPAKPEYNFRRDVDYGSAAAALVRADAWREAGGFDERFSPGYYEDTDLCMRLRELGYRVVYEPRALVVHLEGASHGTGPGDARGKRRQEINHPRFVAKWRATLEAEHHPPPPAGRPRVAADRNRGTQVLVIDHRVPMPDCDSGSLRMFELLRSLREHGCRVTFLPDNLLPEQPYTEWMQSFGIEVLYDPIDLPAELATRANDVSLAIVSRPQIAARHVDAVRERLPKSQVVYDTVDLHYLREQRRADVGEGAPAKAATLREIELALIRACDRTIVISEPERDHVLAEVPDADLVVIPNANDVAVHVPPPDGRMGLVFVGGFQHTPNMDAVIVLVRDVMPHVWRELPDYPVTIVGPHAPPEINALASERVHVAGKVDDLEELLSRARATVAPLRFGAGMKGKVTQSLAAGLPVVTTPVGAEGLGDDPPVLIEEDPAAIAAAVVRLCRDDELWLRLSRAGLRAAEAGWSRELMRERVGALVETARAAFASRY
jgi:GT2 family glycosyltransferase/glycosyltransferase involved in cell wall biosynthesis